MWGGVCQLPSLNSGIVKGTVLGALKASRDPKELRANWAAPEAGLAFCLSVIYSEVPESSPAPCSHPSISPSLIFPTCRMGMKNGPFQPVEG